MKYNNYVIITIGDNMEENLKTMEKFFELDLKIKDLLIKMKPERINYDEHYNIKYVDNLLKTLEIIKESFLNIVNMLNLSNEINSIIESKFKQYESKILSCNYDMGKIQKVYETEFLPMTSGLQEKLEKNLFAYNSNRNDIFVMEKCKTINDYLHAFHFYVVNDEDFYHKMPVIDKKININDEEITLCGRSTELSQNLFKSFPKSLDIGPTDILSFEDKMLVMVRDKGHALSIEVTKEDDKLRVNYFIPKACNVEKVNLVRGVDKLDPEKDKFYTSTRGEFVTTYENFSNDIIGFIVSVPTDDDIVFENSFGNIA